MNFKRVSFFVFALSLVFANSSYAVDYVLAAGESDNISTNVTYEKMVVYGDLSVYVPGGTSSTTKKYVGFTSQLDLIGGNLTIDSQDGGRVMAERRAWICKSGDGIDDDGSCREYVPLGSSFYDQHSA